GMMFIPLLPSLTACGVPEEEHLAIVRERDSLTTVLDELRFGAPRLLAASEAALKAGNLEAARDTARLLIQRHRATTEGTDGERLLAVVEEQIAARDSVLAKTRREAEAAAAERRRLAVAGLDRHRDDVLSMTYYYP